MKDAEIIKSGDPLAPDEAAEFQRLEQIVDKGMKSFIEAGVALMEIREQRLYRAEYGTFEEYLSVKWETSKAYANRLIASAEVVKNLTPIGAILPQNEAQARPLTNLSPEEQKNVWQKAVETAPDGNVTGKHVLEVKNQIIPHQSQSSSKGSGMSGSGGASQRSASRPSFCKSQPTISSGYRKVNPSLPNPSGEPTIDDKAKQLSVDMKTLSEKLSDFVDDIDQIKFESNRTTFEQYRRSLLQTLNGLTQINDAGDQETEGTVQQEGELKNAA